MSIRTVSIERRQNSSIACGEALVGHVARYLRAASPKKPVKISGCGACCICDWFEPLCVWLIIAWERWKEWSKWGPNLVRSWILYLNDLPKVSIYMNWMRRPYRIYSPGELRCVQLGRRRFDRILTLVRHVFCIMQDESEEDGVVQFPTQHLGGLG